MSASVSLADQLRDSQVQFMLSGVRSAPFTTGKHSAGTITSHQIQAMAFRGLEKPPRCHGPLRKRPLSKNSLRKIGVVKEVYCAMAPTGHQYC